MKKEFRAMGCPITVLLESDTLDSAAALDLVPGWFEAWEQSLSRFRDDSELSRVNQNPGVRQSVGETFWEVLQTSLTMEQTSGGLVTPAVLNALESAGYDRSFDSGLIQLLQPADIELSPVTDISEMKIFPETRQILLPEGLRLDFGGTAKGWAAHQTMLRLSEYGPVFVNAGGDISISGLMTANQPWQVGIIDPLKPEMDLVRFLMGKGGVATSGKDYHKWLQNGILRHHIIDPRYGIPAETDILSVSVIAPTVMEAEMAAKVIFILGSEEGGEWLRDFPQYGSLLVLDSGEVMVSQIMKQYLGGKIESTILPI
jgi:FAD:protein FMN transferase